MGWTIVEYSSTYASITPSSFCFAYADGVIDSRLPSGWFQVSSVNCFVPFSAYHSRNATKWAVASPRRIDRVTFVSNSITIGFRQPVSWKAFFLSAALCGIMIATKVVGAFFFLAVGVTIIWALVEKKVTWKRALLSSLAYILILAVFFVLANPFLLSPWARTEYLNVARRQADLLARGYGVVYEKGLKSFSPTLRNYYGEYIFLTSTFVLALIGLFKKQRRFLSALIFSWFLPLTVYIFFFSHFKYQYWLPVALPMFSSWVVAFPDRKNWIDMKAATKIVLVVFLAILIVQSALFISQDINTIKTHLARENNSASIVFYEKVSQVLGPVIDQPLTVYFDYRLYLPDDNNWQKHTSFELMTYDYIREGNFDILLLQQQRIRDYLQEGLTGVNADEFERSQLFYRDADAGNVEGYNLVYRDSTGLVLERKP